MSLLSELIEDCGSDGNDFGLFQPEIIEEMEDELKKMNVAWEIQIADPDSTVSTCALENNGELVSLMLVVKDGMKWLWVFRGLKSKTRIKQLVLAESTRGSGT